MKSTIYMAMTLNGYIARANDSVDFLSDRAWERYEEILAQNDTLIVGRRTFEAIMEQGGDELKKIARTIVVSSQSPAFDGILTSHNPTEAIALAEMAGASKVLIGGGAKLNGAFLSESLVDEIIIDVESVLISDGIPLATAIPDTIELELVDQQISGSIASLHYKVKK